MKSAMSLIRMMSAAILTFISTAVLAGNIPGNNNPVSVHFVSNTNGRTVFELKVAGSENDSYSLTITDLYGNPVYRENIKAASFTKKFIFDTDELSSNNVRLELYNRDKKETRVYEVGITSATTENIRVTEVK